MSSGSVTNEHLKSLISSSHLPWDAPELQIHVTAPLLPGFWELTQALGPAPQVHLYTASSPELLECIW